MTKHYSEESEIVTYQVDGLESIMVVDPVQNRCDQVFSRTIGFPYTEGPLGILSAANRKLNPNLQPKINHFGETDF